MSEMSELNAEIKDMVTPILRKGSSANDWIFTSKIWNDLDKAMAISFLRPVTLFKFGNDKGLSNDCINDMLEKPFFGGDGMQQLIYAAISSLLVYTEHEIALILGYQRKMADVKQRLDYEII